MKRHYVIFCSLLVLGLFISFEAWSLTCYITMAKDNCWKDYNVSVEVRTAGTNKQLTVLNLPKGRHFDRQSFECKPLDTFYYIAKFSPMIWENQAEKTYRAKQNWVIPANMPSDYVIWEVKACYSADFAQVPIPPDATSNCACDFSEIPVLKAPTL